jgi:DNA-binding NarL/FixJ family response regulator
MRDLTEPDAGRAPTAQHASVDQRIRILIVADIRLYREGLADAFRRADRLAVVDAVAGNGDALAVLARAPVDVVLLGLEPGPLTAAACAICRARPGTRLVALAVGERPEDVVPLAEVGICGYVPRDAALPELVAMVEAVARDELPCSPCVAAGLVRRLAALPADVVDPLAGSHLTAREREVLDLLGEGLTNKEIGRRLHIELPTVKNHVHHVLEKLQVQRRAEAVAVVRRGSWT